MSDKEIIFISKYILQNNLTIRKAGGLFSIPKSTLHYNITKRLKDINYSLYYKLHNYLQTNFNEKHLRGGEATKNKYKKIRTIKNNIKNSID